ncbi:MAG: hypothetical protein MRY21_05330 [Simkaniaceae bacterium]|nr:hypothetical protein [Simkaniaceae bacterium]
MRPQNLLFSIVNLFVVLLIMGLGLLCIEVPHSPNVRELVLGLLTESQWVFTAFGYGLLGFGTLLLVGFFMMNRRRYYTIQMEHNRLRVDESIIKDYVRDYWKAQFQRPDDILDVRVGAKQQLEVIAHLPKVEEQAKLLERIENELGVLLARRLGYEKDFLLTIVES